MSKADALGGLAAFVLQQRHCHPIRHCVEHRDGDFGALSAPRPCHQRLQNRLIGVDAGGDIGNRYADPRGRFASAGDGSEAGFGLDQQIVRLAPGIGTALAVTRDRAHDEARIIAAQPSGRKAKFAHGPRLEVLHQDIRFRQHGFEQRLVLGLGEIEHHGFLAAVKPDKIGAFAVDEIVVAAGKIAFRPPASASRHVHIGAATACSRETTRRPERGRVIGVSGGRWLYVVDRATCEPRTHNDLKAVIATLKTSPSRTPSRPVAEVESCTALQLSC